MDRQDISVTTDCVIFHRSNSSLNVLLIQRKSEPFKGMWALPGGFLEEEESLEAGAKRELMKKQVWSLVSCTNLRLSEPLVGTRGVERSV